jgi:putative ABC transport system permease protein
MQRPDANVGRPIRPEEPQMNELRLAGRRLRREPGFAAAVVAMLALAIGANTAILGIVDAVLLRPVPFDDPDGLAVVWETDRHSGTTREPASVPDFLDYRARARTLASLEALLATEVTVIGEAGDPVRLAALRVSHGFLPMLGLRPILGRRFEAGDDRPGGPRVILISARFWGAAFGRDPGVIGRTVRIDDEPWSIVGVMGEEAEFGVLQVLSAAAYSRAWADRGDRVSVDAWLPLQADVRALPRETHPIVMLGRLAGGSTAAAAQQELETIARDLERTHPENAGRGVFVEPLAQVVLGPARPPLLVLQAAVALVLLVAGANVASLLLARGARRSREVGILSALGAGRGALVRQFLAESLVLTAVALGAGVALAAVTLRLLVALAPPEVPRLASAAVDLRVLGAAGALSAVVAVVFGLVPLRQAGRVDLVVALKEGGGLWIAQSGGRIRLRRVLVVAEVALAVVLVAGAGLLAKSFWQLLSVDPGFRAEGVLKAELQLPPARYPVDFARWPDFAEIHAFTERLLARVSAIPGVEAAAVAGDHPLDPGFTNSFAVAGREAEARDWPEISVRRVTPGYFRTVSLGLIRGRLLRESDATSAAPVALLNEAAVRRFFARQDPIGAGIRLWGTVRTIVGVVADERFHGLAEPAPPAVYLPLAQAPSVNGAHVLLVRAAGDPRAIAGSVRAAVRELDPALAVFGMETLDETLARSVGRRRFLVALLGAFAAVGLLLAATGLAALLSYTVAARRREIGVRLALGAGRPRVLALVIGEGLSLSAAGLALGVAASLAVSRVLASLLAGVGPSDPATFAVVSGLVLVVALAATLLPAWRAASIDPATACRAE